MNVRYVARPPSPARKAPWPERFPLLGPLTGVAVSAGGATVALTKNDWGATTIFGAIAAVLAFAGLRNFRTITEKDEPTSR